MAPTLAWYALCVSFTALLALSQPPPQTFFPASVPLANRSPYMSAWYNSIQGALPLSQSWPVFWNQQDHLGWVGKIRVDGTSYEWMSFNLAPTVGNANVTNIKITPTRSIFTMQAGPVNMTITFLSPIEPSDWVLQSLPFSYLSIEASSLDGQEHHIQVYSDITAEWLSGNRVSDVMWGHNTTSSSAFFEIQLQSPLEGVEEVNQQAQDGISYYATANAPGMTWQLGGDAVVRGDFDKQGVLANNFSTAFAPMEPVWTVFGFALDLGMIKSTPSPVTWAIGYVRDPSIIYTAPDSGVHRLRPYFVTKYGTNIAAAIDDFLSGYADALQRAIAFDDAVIASASAVSSQYADLVSLAARQVLSTLDITVTTGSDGNPNASDVRIFMKNIGEANSTTGRVNPVERIYAALPALLYFNSSLVGPLLAPLLDAQDDLGSNPPYATQDIGTTYPHATGAHWPHGQGVEQSGNMLIVLYAHARFSGDGSLLQKHYALAKRWADYLINNTLRPTNQAPVDDASPAAVTNLAIKGIIAVKAMAQISRALGEDTDVQEYDSQAAALYDQWQSLVLSSNQQHMLGADDDQESWALMYNFYADRLLGTNVVSQTLLQSQTAFYKLLLSTSPPFGLKLDSTVQESSIAWLLFTAGIVSDDGVRDGLVRGAWARASSNVTIGAFPDHYDVQTGAVLDGSAGPAVGGVFSLLALNLTAKDIIASSEPQPRGPVKNPRNPVGPMAGGIAGGMALIVLVAAGVCFVMRRRRRRLALLHPNLHPWPTSTYSPPSQLQNPRTPCYDIGIEGASRDPANTMAILEPNMADATSPATLAPLGRPSLPEISKPDEGPERAVQARDPVSSNALPHQAGDASSHMHEPPRSSWSTGSGGSTEMRGLRTEMESLRRAVLEIQEERLAPPPEYTG